MTADDTRATYRPTSGPPDSRCTCPRAWKSLGTLYGISMGKGWVRLDTEPACPEHGTTRRKERQ